MKDIYSCVCSEYTHDNYVYEELAWSTCLEENCGILMMDGPSCEEVYV